MSHLYLGAHFLGQSINRLKGQSCLEENESTGDRAMPCCLPQKSRQISSRRHGTNLRSPAGSEDKEQMQWYETAGKWDRTPRSPLSISFGILHSLSRSQQYSFPNQRGSAQTGFCSNGKWSLHIPWINHRAALCILGIFQMSFCWILIFPPPPYPLSPFL